MTGSLMDTHVWEGGSLKDSMVTSFTPRVDDGSSSSRVELIDDGRKD